MLLLLVAMVLATSTAVQGQCVSIQMCECVSYTQTLTCSKIGPSLSSILPNIPSFIRLLEITGASMYSFKEQDFQSIGSNSISELRITNGLTQSISDQAFKKFQLVRKLTLNHNEINSITATAFSGVGDLRTLDMSHNRIASLANTDMFKPVIRVTDLDLSNNQLTEIPDGLLDPLRSLHNLNLNGNRISSLKGSAFQGASAIRSLHASRNGLRTIDDDFFNKLPMIDLLDLSFNALTAVPGNGKLNLLTHLRNLTLQGNMITVLPDEAFKGLNLDVLDLSKNGISGLSANTFMYMGSLRNLDLSNNKLVHLPDYLFQPIAAQLYSLKLGNNRGLITLPNTIFNGMQMLNALDLSFCSLSELYDTQFASIFSLQQVDISHNMLSSLPESFLSKATQMVRVRINNNRWVCDCYIKPLRDWLKFPRSASILSCSDENTPAGFNSICASQTCSSPQQLLYRNIDTLQDQEIPTCENLAESGSAPIDVIIGVIAGVIVCILVVIIILCCCCRRHKRGEPLLCGTNGKKSRKKKSRKRESQEDFFKEKREKKGERGEKREKRPNIDPEVGSLNESDKGFVVRNYFHSMEPDTDDASMGTQSMTRRGSQESMSHSGYAYGSQAGSRTSSQYSSHSGYRVESAV